MKRKNKEEKALLDIFNKVLLEEVKQKHTKNEYKLIDKIFTDCFIACKKNDVKIVFNFTPIKQKKSKK